MLDYVSTTARFPCCQNLESLNISLLSTEVLAKLLSRITSPRPVLFIDTGKLLPSHHNTILVTKFSTHLIKICFNCNMNIIVCDSGQ